MTRQERRQRCGEMGHVGATYNPWLRQTWCLCGEVVRPGNVATHDDCCADAPAPDVQAVLALCEHPSFVVGCQQCEARANAAGGLLVARVDEVARSIGLP